MRYPPECVSIEVSARCPDGEKRSVSVRGRKDEAERHVSICLGTKQDGETGWNENIQTKKRDLFISPDRD